MIVKRFVLGELSTNVYLIQKENECLIVDPACNFEFIKNIIGNLKLVGILVTHYHFDHVGALDELKKYYDVSLFDNNDDLNNLINFDFEIIHNPGHSSDSVSFYFKNEKMIVPKLNANAKVSIICLILTVCIRSYVGLILAFEWKGNFILALLSILAVVFGKMLGGIIGDKIGFNKISIVSLAVSSICFIFAFNNPFLGILAMLFFNMTMPITLTALSNILDSNKGMAFGLLTLALFIGSIPKFFGIGITTIFTPRGLCFITIVSLIVLVIGIKKYNIFMEKRI